MLCHLTLRTARFGLVHLRVYRGLVVSADAPLGELAGLTLRDVERLCRLHCWMLGPHQLVELALDDTAALPLATADEAA